jgi:hypothetical protein
MAKRETKQAKLDLDAHRHLETLQRQLGRQSLPRDVDLTDILSALVLYTTPPQLAGMLAEYWRYTEARAEAEARGQPPPMLPTWG